MTNIETLCLNCMKDKGWTGSCKYCGSVEQKRNAVALPFKTLLNNRFLIGPVLGRPGGFGVTYLAWDILLDTTAAIKEFLPLSAVSRDVDTISVRANSKQDQDFYQQGLRIFLKEAKTLAQFSHPNIVRIRDYFMANNTAYLVMEYHNGRALDQVVADSGGVLNEDRAIEIMLPILDGLGAIHKKGFLHRDIKPQNIYLTDKDVPILLDFGASRFAVVDSNQTLTVMLSAGYAPFEQYHKKGKQGPWSDIYSCGATLFFMVTGQMPVDAIERQQEDIQLSPISYNPQLSESFCLSIVKAMSNNPHARPQNINSFKRVISGNSYLSNHAIKTDINVQSLTVSSQPIAVQKPARQPAVIKYQANETNSVLSNKVFYSVLAACVLWFWLDFQQSSEQGAAKVSKQEVGQQQSKVEPNHRQSTNLPANQKETTELMKVNSVLKPEPHNLDDVQLPPPQIIFSEPPLNPPPHPKWMEQAPPGHIASHKPLGISESAVRACKDRQKHAKCHFDFQSERQFGRCVPVESEQLACLTRQHAIRSHPPRPKHRH